MIGQPNRLPAEGEHRFQGTEIDRRQPLHFKLDGYHVRGFAGDTVLSAALASGLIGAGTRHGEALALDERFAPPVLIQGNVLDVAKALPMERTPAIGGLDLVTVERARRPLYRRALDAALGILPSRRGRLGLHFDGDASVTAPWLDAAPHRQLVADLIVVGGGLAGMGAALAAGRRGQRVVLIERRQSLGGDARFFGSAGDEEPPEAAIDRLGKAIAGLGKVTVLLRAEAFALFEGIVRVNLVEIVDGVPVSLVLSVNAPRIVLANGVVERLPIFAGNRRPGVVGALAAFDRAERFGVWLGRRTVVGTSTSFAYRLATQAKNAGIDVERIADSRLEPQSRFIEFGKAYGIPMLRATRPQRASAADRYGRGLRVHLDASIAGTAGAAQEFTLDQLVVAGGWQPDLTLWHMAGGVSRWDATTSSVVADGALPGIMLAGSVAGYRNALACLKSGEAAAATLFGRSAPAIDDPMIDTRHELPDDPTPIAPFEADVDGDAYLDSGTSFTVRPAPESRESAAVGAAPRPHWGFADQARALSVADVAAGVQLGAIPPDDAATVAQERCVTPGDIVDAGRLQPQILPSSPSSGGPPAYLAGRFGTKPVIRWVAAADGRNFEVGCLLYANADRADPLTAIGAVFGAAPPGGSGGMALIARSAAVAAAATVRDISGPIAVQLRDPAARSETPAAPVAVPIAGAVPAPEIATPPMPAAPEHSTGTGAPIGETAAQSGTALPSPAPAVPARTDGATIPAGEAPALPEALTSALPAAQEQKNGGAAPNDESTGPAQAGIPLAESPASPSTLGKIVGDGAAPNGMPGIAASADTVAEASRSA